MASRVDNYMKVVTEIPAFAFTTSAATVPAFTAPTPQTSYVLCVSADAALYIRLGGTATLNSLRIPANTMYHLSYALGQSISIMGAGAGTASLTLLA